jgi:3-hydroxybutyryl-CoA dehydrogenase
MLWGTNWETKRLDRAAIIKSDFIDKGKMGKQWEGFYKYPTKIC